MTNSSTHIVFVGCGKMGGALLDGMIQNKTLTDAEVSIVDPNYSAPDHDMVSSYGSVDALPSGKGIDILLVAIKPQLFDVVLADYKTIVNENTLVLSVAAGKTIASIASYFNENQPVVRVMPNLPSTIGMGVSVCVAANVTEAQKVRAEALLAGAGNVTWVEDEDMMDAVTAVSGSGPAYVFHFVESFTQAAIAAGLPDDVAKALAYQTVSGSAALLAQSDDNATTLRENVTSPNGTTAAGLSALMEDGALQELLVEAVDRAKKRSIELGA